MKTRFYYDLGQARSVMLALLFMVCGAGFVSCGSDDDEEGGGGSTNLPTIDANEQIASIYDSDNDIIFNYKDGVMTGGQIVEGGSFTITSSGIVYEEGGSDELYRETYTIKKRNSFGAVTSADVKCVEVGYGEQYTGNGTMTASYDSDNHLTSMNFSVSDGDFSESIKFTFTWSGGNLLKAVYEYVEEEYGYVYKDEETYVYEYGSDAVSNSGVYIPGFLTDMEYICYSGLLGRPTKNIPTSIDGYEVTVNLDSHDRVMDLYIGGYKYASYAYNSGANDVLPSPRKAASANRKHSVIRRMFSALRAR